MGVFNKNSAECEACSVFSHIRSEHIDAAWMEALSGNWKFWALPLPSISDPSFKGWLAEQEQWLQQLQGGRQFTKMKGWGCDWRKEMGRNIPTGERMENDILSFAEWGADLPSALLLASLASLGSSLLRSEHASIARGTSSAVPGQQVPDQELRREQSFSLAPPTGPEPKSCDRQPRLPKGGGNVSLRETVSRGNTDRKWRDRVPVLPEPSGGCESRSGAAYRILRSGDPEKPGSERVGKRVRGIGDESPRLSSELSFCRSSPTYAVQTRGTVISTSSSVFWCSWLWMSVWR